ncbi:hypothetical protein BC835DRAFT_1405006 [Cytidiella melzeri]|nr:hypothetical protein BC835DRAFT_1405006 [Cytidiella melzeri]
MEKWDILSRLSLDAASTATSVGFSAAKAGTKLGFSITRAVASSAAGLTGSAIDHAFFGGHVGAGPVLGGAVSSAISAVEALTLAPILLGETLASTTLVAAHSSLSVLQAIFPGSDETSFSLASFITLVRRELSDDMNDTSSPQNKYGINETMKALVAWAALQGVTSDSHEKRWFQYLKEIHVNEELLVKASASSEHLPKDEWDDWIHVTEDFLYPDHGGEIITADIGLASAPQRPVAQTFDSQADEHRIDDHLKATLRRLSKLVLAGYGGASLLFFGVPPVPPALSPAAKSNEQANLAAAIGSAEKEAARSFTHPSTSSVLQAPAPSYSWWNILRGRHDKDILLHYAQAESHKPAAIRDSAAQSHPPVDAMLGTNVSLMPRFWVLTDHSRHEVVLVIRGTMSLNELAVDLTCDPADFRVKSSRRPSGTADADEQAELEAFHEQLEGMPGSFPLDLSTPPISDCSLHRAHSRHSTGSSTFSENGDVYQVHGGMLKMARVMGGKGKPVYMAVKHALKQNDSYSLVICGHSLGAGVAGLLALMWADPYTCLTHRASGLPSRRRVSAFCYAPPCLVSARLSRLAAENNLITSFVYSHDIVSRLSLGSVRDMRRATAWLCEAEKDKRGDGYSAVTARVLKNKAGYGKPDDPQWFLAMRKTLEANMHMANLYPPGRVLWAMHDSDLHPSQRLPYAGRAGKDKLRLFDVQDVEEVFGQIIFAKDMLSSHMPHQYDRVSHELL